MPHAANDPSHNSHTALAPPLTDAELLGTPNIAPSQWLSPDLLEGVGKAAIGFHGADEHHVGRFIGGTVRDPFQSLLVMNEGEPPIEAGRGISPHEALQRTYEAMHRLETATTPKAEVRIPMTDKASVDFTPVEHYAPRIAPGTEPDKVPFYLQATVEASKHANDSAAATYRETIKQPGWDKQLFSMAGEYLAQPDGQKLQEALRIKDLAALTPEQAIKLSVGMVQALSKYEYDEQGRPAGERADAMTAMDLLKEGMDHGNNPNWQGNGVCRNVASNVKAVFEALKRNQGDLSMLRNTYAVYTSGMDGAGYRDQRDDQQSNLSQRRAEDITGHAWNTFVTIDAKGSANITVVDATWVLEHDAESALKHADYTIERTARTAMALFMASENREEAFGGITQYFGKLMHRRGLSLERSKELRAFAVGHYLRAARKVLEEVPENEPLPWVPSGIALGAAELRDRLHESELETLFALHKRHALLDDKMQAIVHQYAALPETVVRPDWQSKKRLLQRDDELQTMIFEAMGADKVAAFAEEDGRFRARVREIQPEALPKFDPEREADAKELVALTANYDLRVRKPEEIMAAAHRRLKQAANGNQALLDAVLFGRSDYDIVKHMPGLQKHLKKLAS